MQNLFKDKVVWIIGASSGIGEALAYDFSRENAKIILSARNEKELERVKQNCRGNKENIEVLPLNLSITDDIKDRAKQGLSFWGSIDYLILNAGIAARDLAQNIELKVDREIMETNYFGTITLTKAVLPSMIERGHGHIVVMSSLSGKYGVPKLSAYAASKHALHGFFDSLRTEVSPLGIKISIIIPGFINTSISKKALDGKGHNIDKNMRVNENGMPPQICSLKIINAIKRGKQEALIGGTEILSVYLYRFFPKLFRSIIGNHPIQKLRHLFPKLFK